VRVSVCRGLCPQGSDGEGESVEYGFRTPPKETERGGDAPFDGATGLLGLQELRHDRRASERGETEVKAEEQNPHGQGKLDEHQSHGNPP